VLGYHQRRCRDEDAAHELTAETFAQVWLVRARFRDECEGSAGPWLFGVARNVLLVSVRRRVLEARARERLGVLVTPPAVSPQEAWLDGLDDDEVPEAVRLRGDRRTGIRRGRRRPRYDARRRPRARPPRTRRAS
jgi:DNA-directed RNA polymerase specialized sigma24 family protein